MNGLNESDAITQDKLPEIKEKQPFAISMLILTTILWGSTFVVTKTAVAMVPTHFYMGVRFLFAALSFVPFIKRFDKIDKKKIKTCFISGLLYWLQSLTQALGLETTTASKSGFITALNIIFIPIIMGIFYKEKLSRNIWIGVTFAVVGTGFLSFYGHNGLDGLVIGDLWTLGSAFSGALFVIYLGLHIHDMDIFLYTFLQVSFVSLFSFGSSALLEDWGYIFGENSSEIFTIPFILIVIYAGLISTNLALFTQNYGQQYVKPSKAAVIFSFEPVFAALFGILFSGEILTTGLAIGAVLIFIGVIMSQIKLKRKGKKGV